MAADAPLKAIALVGATGTGKSALAMELAESDDTCLISCDSMQVYRGLDIGTAKPSLEEQHRVRHELIDCADISETWSAQTWADAARDVIRAENSRGKIPIIVGGTGMYLKALLEGFADVPAEKEGVREHFESLQSQFGTPHLHEMLLAVDPQLAARLERQDTQRIVRGLSVYESTGVPLSLWHQRQKETQARARDSLDCPVYVLDMERALLRQRLADRCEQMMARGWLEETRWLLQQHIAETHPVMRAVGYRQLLEHLRGRCELERAVENAITATRRYGKRQRTWFQNQTPQAIHGDKALLFQQISLLSRRL